LNKRGIYYSELKEKYLESLIKDQMYYEALLKRGIINLLLLLYILLGVKVWKIKITKFFLRKKVNYVMIKYSVAKFS